MSTRIDSAVIGQSIKSLRLSRNWTQERLAETIGYSVRNLRRIETDGTKSIDVVNAFAELFGVDAIDILDGDVFLFYIRKKALAAFAIRYLLQFVVRTLAHRAEQEGATLMLPVRAVSDRT